jgi:hypothetical protein
MLEDPDQTCICMDEKRVVTAYFLQHINVIAEWLNGYP